MDFSVSISGIPEVQRLLEKAPEQALPAFKKLAFDVYGRLQQKSPVKSGLFKGSWLASVNTIPSGIGAPGQSNRSGINALTSIRQTVFIVNNLPYARRLENGWSRQAPSGVVRPTLAEMGLRYT